MWTIPWLLLLGCTLFGCATTRETGHYASEVPGLSTDRLLAGTDEPALFLGPEGDAPAVGYAATDLRVRIVGQPRGARVAVQVLGPLEVRAHAPIKLLSLRVQRRGRLRDTPVYLGPNDRVRLLGPAADPGRVRVVATPLLIGHSTPPYEGTYPTLGLAAELAPETALSPEPGAPYQLAAGVQFSLFDVPNGKLILGPKASPLPMDLTVLRQEGAWFAVRIGSGPYLIGYTNAPISPRAPATPVAIGAVQKARAPIPARLMHEQGALKRVAAGTQLFFNNAPIGMLHSEGWARVLTEYSNGEVDAFVAIDDSVAVRALLPREALRDAVVPAAAEVRGQTYPAPVRP